MVKINDANLVKQFILNSHYLAPIFNGYHRTNPTD